jgi:hypothetical protein
MLVETRLAASPASAQVKLFVEEVPYTAIPYD